LIFLQVSRVFLIFVNEGSMAKAKVYQGFHDDKSVEEHCSRATFNNLWSKSYVCHKL